MPSFSNGSRIFSNTCHLRDPLPTRTPQRRDARAVSGPLWPSCSTKRSSRRRDAALAEGSFVERLRPGERVNLLDPTKQVAVRWPLVLRVEPHEPTLVGH